MYLRLKSLYTEGGSKIKDQRSKLLQVDGKCGCIDIKIVDECMEKAVRIKDIQERNENGLFMISASIRKECGTVGRKDES